MAATNDYIKKRIRVKWEIIYVAVGCMLENIECGDAR